MNAKTDLTSVLSQISHYCHHHHHHYDHHHFRTRAMYLVDWQIQSWPIKSFETVFEPIGDQQFDSESNSGNGKLDNEKLLGLSVLYKY